MNRLYKLLLIAFICLLSTNSYSAEPKADKIRTDTTNFNNTLNTSDDNVQKALDKLENVTASGHAAVTVTNSTTVGITLSGQDLTPALLGFTGFTTNDLTESGNLYFTDVRARLAISNGTGISYNNTTGVINSTITQYTDALARTAINETITGIDYNATSGNFTLTSGYIIPTSTEETNWNTTYIWGNHSLAGYLTSLTPWTSNIDGAGYNLTNVTAVGIGTTSPSVPLNVIGDATITGSIIQGEGTTDTSGIKIYDSSDAQLWFYEGSSLATGFYAPYNKDQLLFMLGSAVGRQLVLTTPNFYVRDFDHSVQTNPTLFIHSATDPDTNNTQWLSFTHDQTNGVIDVGTGNLNITDNLNVIGTGNFSDNVTAPFYLGNGSQLTGIAAGANDTAYGAGWNGTTDQAPSQNAVYDKIETLITGGISNIVEDLTPQLGGDLDGQTFNITNMGYGNFTTLDTGQGANELYDMNQNVMNTSEPTFVNITITGLSGIIKATTGKLGNATADTDYLVTLSKDLVTTPPLTGGTDNILPGADTDITIAIPRANATVDGYINATVDFVNFNATYTNYANRSTFVNTTAPITGGGNLSADRTIAMAQSNATVNGYLDSANWTVFNNSVDTTRRINTTSPITGAGNLSTDVTVAINKANATQDGYLNGTVDFVAFNAKVATTRNINTTAPITGGGDLSADRTMALTVLGDIVATTPLLINATTAVNDILTGADRDVTVSIPKATTSVDGYLNATDWTTFNNKGTSNFTANQAVNTTSNVTFGNVTTASGNFTGTGDSYFNEQVAIGQTSAAYLLDILGADNTTIMRIKNNANQAATTAADIFISFDSTTGVEANIAGTAVAGVIAYNTFLGSHWTKIEGEMPKVGMVLEMTGEVTDKGQGGFAYLAKSRICKTAGSNKIYGVYGGTDKDGHDLVFAVGAGVVLVSGKVKAGDLLEADGNGYARKQESSFVMNSTLGRATQDYNGKEGIKLIGCVFYSG